MKSLVLGFVVVALAGCSKEKEAATAEAAPAPAAAPRVAAPAAPVAASPTAAPSSGPLDLDEAKFQRWMAFRKEMNESMRKNLSSTPAHKGQPTAADTAQAWKDLAAAGQDIEALRKKAGFTQQEDDRIGKAASAVWGARSKDNPMLASTYQMMEKFQKAGGQQKAMADKFFKDQEEKEKQEIAKATAMYGAPAIELLSKHAKEIGDMMMDTMGAAFGKKPTPPGGTH